MVKYVIQDTVSDIDEIAGFAISAGSILHVFAISGIMDPSTFAKITMASIETQTVKAIELG